MRKREMIFYPKTGDDGKDGEHPPRPITGDIYMISYIDV
jgi:hypothetical protein